MLKHYEKHGILDSQRKGVGGYRYYNFSQSPRILFTKQLQNWGFSLKDISLIIKGVSPDRSLKLLVQKLDILKQEHRTLNWQIKSLETFCTVLSHVKNGKFDGQWSIQDSDKYCFLPHSEGADFIPFNQQYKSLQSWINLQGITMQGALISNIHSANPIIQHGFIAPEDAIQDLGLDSRKYAISLGGAKSLIYNITHSDQNGITSEEFTSVILKKPQAIIEKHNLDLSDKAFLLTYFLTKEEETIFRHRQLIIPLRETD